MTERLSKELEELQREGMLRTIPRIDGTKKYIEFDGRRMLNLSSNDYLGLQNNSALMEEFTKSCNGLYSLSSTSSRLLTGNTSVSEQLEEKLAAIYGKEAALLFNSGYHANTGILPALTESDSLIIADKLVHASIIDGIKLSGCPFQRYRHNDYNHLESILKKNAACHKDIFVVTEGIFSMDGDCADIPKLMELKRLYPNIILYIDEAHAFGTRGTAGVGIASETEGGVEAADIIVGTFGKAICSVGAFAVCSQKVKDYLVNRCRPLIFSTALPPINIAWTLFVTERLGDFTQKREHLKKLSAYVRENLVKAGSSYSGVSSSNIIPYMTYTADKSVLMAGELRRRGFYLLPIRPPTVPVQTSRIRISLTAEISLEEIKPLFKIITKIENQF